MPREFGNRRNASPSGGATEPTFNVEPDPNPTTVDIGNKSYSISRFKWKNDKGQSGETVRIVRAFVTRRGDQGTDKKPGLSINADASEEEVKTLLDAIYDKLFSREDEH